MKSAPAADHRLVERRHRVGVELQEPGYPARIIWEEVDVPAHYQAYLDWKEESNEP